MKHRLLIFFLAIFSLSNAQQAPIWHYWVDVNPAVDISKKLRVFGDIGVQRYVLDQPLTRTNFRPGLMYKLHHNIKATTGVGYFITHEHENLKLQELRLFLGLQYQWPRYTHFTLAHYLRWEVRNFWSNNPQSKTVSSRLRYELQNQVAWTSIGIPLEKWFSPIAVEAFLGLGAQSKMATFFEQLRVTAGIGYQLNAKSRLALLYIYQGREAQLNDFLLHTTDHMFRLRYYLTF